MTVNLKFILAMVLRKKLENGNVVILEYIVTNKTSSNGAKTFGFTSEVSVVLQMFL